MKKYVVSAVAVLSLAATPALNASVQHLLPKVKQCALKTSHGFMLNRGVVVTDPTDCALLEEILAEAGMTVAEQADATVEVSLVSSIPGAFNHNLAGYPDEAYYIDVSENKITINAVTPTGVIRAAQTLGQLALETDRLEACTITDWPAFKLRGLMHDVGRSFISVEELKKEIRLLSAFKVNTFHWHLTENQAWRFEVKAYPALTSTESMTRFAGQYYTQEQCREVLAEAKKYGVTVIPEIDMPGHSEAFERAMGFEMQSEQGKQVLQKVLEEVADVFADSPYIHMGADEKTITDNTFLDTMIDKLHSLCKKVVCWNPIRGVNLSNHNFDMTQMWSTSGNKVAGMPNIDCRYNYINHFDVFADLVGIYKSSIYYEQQGTDEVAGTITAVWNDRKTPGETDIIAQNNIYACTLASAERAWVGGGKQYIETGGTMLPNSGEEFEEFADWEARFLMHKSLSLKDEPIPYVKQTNVRWYVTEQFDNGGDANASFAPEQGLDNPTWSVTPVTGAGIYLRHTWGGTVPGLYGNASTNRTAYAYTYVYSPVAQTVGAQIEFQNYGRSENDSAPEKGKWDRKGSRIWLNDEEILPREWGNTGKSINSEVDLLNENFPAREPIAVQLKEGWNKVFIKLPYVGAGGVRLNKWMWTFVLTDLEGKNAIEGLTYSPSKSIDEYAEALATLIAEARSKVKSIIKDEVGYYSSSALDQAVMEAIERLEPTLSEDMTAEERAAQCSEIQTLLDAFMAGYAAGGIVQPSAGVYYYMNTPLRNSRYASADNHLVLGVNPPTEASAWTFSRRADGSYDIVNYSTGEFVAPTAANNTQLTLVTTAPQAGWQVKAADEAGYVIMVSGSVQFNQTNLANKVYNWGNGANVSDAGCKYVFTATTYTDKVTERLNQLIAEARTKVETYIKDEVGYYPSTELDRDLIAAVEEIEQTLGNAGVTEAERTAQLERLQTMLDAFIAGYAANGINGPEAEVYYTMHTPLRASRYASAADHLLLGNASATEASAWVFKTRTDGACDIENYATGEYVSPEAASNTQLSLTEAVPAAGWSVLPADEVGYVIIVSGTSQFNQTNAGLGYKVYNWGGGTRTDEGGCKYVFTKSEYQKTQNAMGRIEAAGAEADAVVYDLHGRRLAKPVRGINIINGRKVVMM